MSMKQVFVEAHNLKNPYGGLGQFNLNLLDAISQEDLSGLEIVLNVKDPEKWKNRWGNAFSYRKYSSLHRHKPFRIRKQYDLWHSLNQNIKIEPARVLPYILTIHDIHFMYEGTAGERERMRMLFQDKIDRADIIVFISQFAKQDTLNHFDLEGIQLEVIYNGNTIQNADVPNNFRPEMVPDRPFLFSIGDFSKRKNFKTLIGMLAQLPELGLVLAGNDQTKYGDELRAMAERLDGVAIDILINNAGVAGGDSRDMAALDVESIAWILNVNTLGPLRVIQALYPNLQASEKKLVVNII